MKFAKEFREFISKGNVLNLAVAVIIGGAFQAIINSLVNDIIMPIISIATGGIDFQNWFVALDGSHYATLAEAQEAGAATLNYGVFINAIIRFILMAIVIFIIVKVFTSAAEKAKKAFSGHELQGKRVGLVGFGAVAQATAKILDGFDCEVCYYDYKGRAFGHYTPLSLEELFATCDVVSLHLPVSDSTRGLVDEKLLRSMKKDALFVNAGRSALVDTQALIRVLNDRAIAGAVLDVLDNEPPTAEDLEIMNCPNVILTPHICGATYEVTNHQADILNARIRQWLAGENLEKIVYNRDVLKP